MARAKQDDVKDLPQVEQKVKPTEELGRAVGAGDVTLVDVEQVSEQTPVVAVGNTGKGANAVQYAVEVKGEDPREILPPAQNPATSGAALGVQMVGQKFSKLQDFIVHHEELAQAQGLWVVEASFPGAGEQIYQGRYAGIRLSDGPQSVTYNDGSKH